MVKEHLSEDQRILAVEQSIPGIQRALDSLSDRVNALQFNAQSPIGFDFIQPRNRLVDASLFEQTLSILRTLYLSPVPPPPPDPPLSNPGLIVRLNKGAITELIGVPGVETDVCFWIEVDLSDGSEFEVTITKPDGTTVLVRVKRGMPVLIKGKFTSIVVKAVGTIPRDQMNNVQEVNRGRIIPC